MILNESANNTYSGDTIINNGIVQPGSSITGQRYIPGNLIINTNGSFTAVAGSIGSGLFTPNSWLVLNGNNPNGNVWVASGAWITAPNAVLANGCVITNVGGGTSGAYQVTNTDARAGFIWLTRDAFNQPMNMFKSTAGNVQISTRPNSSANDGYVVTLNAGSLIFDYAYANNASVKLKSGYPVAYQGGQLVFSNALSTLNPSGMLPSATAFNSGSSSLLITNAGTGGTLALGTVTRKTGATFNLFKPAESAFATAVFATNQPSVNGIVGGWCTYNLTDWTAGYYATNSWQAYSNGFYQTDLNPANWGATSNVSVGASALSQNVPDPTTINSLRLTAANTVTLVGSLTLTSGGLLVTGSGATAITGGTLYGASGADLIVHQYASAALTISSTLANNGAADGSLTKDGSGKLIINGVNNLTGTNFLNGGVVEISSLSELASGPLDMNNGTIHYTGSSDSDARTLTTRGVGPIFNIDGGVTLTQSGAIIGSGEAYGDFGGLTKIGNGTLSLTASNYYNGETVVSNGVLALNGINGCNPAVWDSGRITVYGGTLQGNGTNYGPVGIKNGGTITAGNSIGTLTLATNLTLDSGSTCLFEVGDTPPNDLIIVGGNLTVNNATINIAAQGTLDVGTYTLITYSGTLSGSFNPTVVIASGTVNGSMSISTSTQGQINLVVSPNVVITQQPTNNAVQPNNELTTTVAATGQSPISYYWFFYGSTPLNAGTNVVGQNASTLDILNAQTTDGGYYACVVSNAAGPVTSSPCVLIVGDYCPAYTGPNSLIVTQGNNGTFSVNVQLASPPATFDWWSNGVPTGTDLGGPLGQTNASVTFTNVQFSMNGISICVVVTNEACMETSCVTMTVWVPPTICLQPVDTTVNAGTATSLTSCGAGYPAPTFQWYKNTTRATLNATALGGQNAATLSFSPAQGTDNGYYFMVANNSAGSVTSSVVQLSVISTTLAPTAFTPANAAPSVCYDTPLYVTFNDTVSIVNSGKIRIYNTTGPTLVDTIDMSANTVIVSPNISLTNNVQPHSLFSGDAQVIYYFPVIVNGNQAAIYPHSGVMTSNQTYYVTMDAGIVAGSDGALFQGISSPSTWQFTTKIGGPLNPTNIIVAADGSGDFVTVQGAVDSVPVSNTAYTLVNIKNGNYVEILDISGKNNITFLGQSRTGTFVGYANNNNLNGSTASRASIKVNSSDIKFENLTMTNATPQAGSQAEVLLVYNNGLRCVVNNCDINSRQDTILINAATSQAYISHCKILGNFDYIWGVGQGYFDDCYFITISNSFSASYNLTAARTDAKTGADSTHIWVNPNGTTYSQDGFTFVKCTFDADPGVSGITLAGNNGTSGGQDDFIDCCFSSAYVTPTLAISNAFVLWQYNCHDITCLNPISFATVQTITSPTDPRLLASTNINAWFYGWSPAMAPSLRPILPVRLSVIWTRMRPSLWYPQEFPTRRINGSQTAFRSPEPPAPPTPGAMCN